MVQAEICKGDDRCIGIRMSGRLLRGKTKEEISNVVKEDKRLVRWRKRMQKTWVYTVQANDWLWLQLKGATESRDK